MAVDVMAQWSTCGVVCAYFVTITACLCAFAWASSKFWGWHG